MMNMYSSINAKYDEVTGKYVSLFDHTDDVLRNLKMIIDANGILERYSKELDLAPELLRYLIFNCAFFHDVGKATREFQKKLAEKSRRTDVPHSIHSAALINKFPQFSVYGVNIVALVIATHHSKLDSQLYSDEKFLYTPNYMKTEICEFVSHNYSKSASVFGITGVIEDKNISFEFDAYVRNSIFEYSDALVYHKREFNLLYTLLNGLLKLSDWLASADKTFEELSIKDIEALMIKNIQLKGRAFNGWRNFQQHAKEIQGHIIIKASTGSGKTEASMLWAMNNISSGSRIIYALPTQTTINKMYERMADIFGDSVGIVHSAAKDYLEEKEDSDIDEYTLMKTFIKPITITTLDSFLFSFLPVGPYTQRQINLFNSIIILDELHAYDQQIIGFLLELLKNKQFMNFKICLMSATLPHVITDIFRDILGSEKVSIIVDDESYNRVLYKIDMLDNKISDMLVLDRIKDAYSAGKKVIVRTNTIRKSIEVYRQLERLIKKDVILFNSNFVIQDRVKKEDIICKISDNNRPFVVVCTSIIQISLDIDYDIMFTELCPIDDLVQAGGRINRYGIRSDTRLIVCSNGGNYHPYPNPRVVDDTKNCVAEYSNRFISLKQADNLIDKVYYELNSSELSHGKDIYDKYATKIEKINAREDNIRLRKESYVSVDVVPQELLSEAVKLSKIILHVPSYVVLKYPSYFREISDKRILATLIAYSSDDGLRYLDVEQIKSAAETFDNII